ncbi:MAG: tyrosine-type recombinase/integrase, partial [Actinomycetota bacterium]|nr:tyrosine-type recombinase/integrase [Actinomycetota bacterium]
MAKGHIEKLKTRYRACVYVGKDPITGRKTYLKETFLTEALARVGLERMLTQVEAENTPDQSATLAVLLDRWREVAGHELTTAHTVSSYVRRTIVPALGDMKLRKLQHRVDLLDRFYMHLTRCGALCTGEPRTDHKKCGAHDCAAEGCGPHVCKGMSPATVRQIHAILSAAFGYGVSWGWMDKNPAEYAHPPKIKRRRARPPQAEQVGRLLNLAGETDTELAVYLWLAVVTGARRGELAALRWSSVDLRAATMRIELNYVVRGGQRRLKGTKTDEDRPLSLDTLTVRMLTVFQA